MYSTQLYNNAMVPGDVVDRRAPISLGRPLTFVSTTDLERNDSEETIVPGTPKATISLGDQYIPASFTSMAELCELVDRQSLTLETLASSVRPLSTTSQGTPEHHMSASPSDKTFLLLLATPISPAICLHACEADEKTMNILQQAVEHNWSRGVPNSNFPDEQTSTSVTSGRAMARVYSDLRRRFPHPQTQYVPARMQKWVMRAHANGFDGERCASKGVLDPESRFQILHRRSELYRQYASRVAGYASDIISRSIAVGRGRLRVGSGRQNGDDELASMV